MNLFMDHCIVVFKMWLNVKSKMNLPIQKMNQPELKLTHVLTIP